MEYPKKRRNKARELVWGIFTVLFSIQNGRDMWYIGGWHRVGSLAFWGSFIQKEQSEEATFTKQPGKLGHSKVNMTFLVSGLLACEFSLWHPSSLR